MLNHPPESDIAPGYKFQNLDIWKDVSVITASIDEMDSDSNAPRPSHITSLIDDQKLQSQLSQSVTHVDAREAGPYQNAIERLVRHLECKGIYGQQNLEMPDKFKVYNL